MVDSEDRYSTEKASSVQSSVQFNPSKPVIFSYNQVEVLYKISSVPWVQISRSSARYSAGKSEELSRSLRRFCPSPDHPVEACQLLHGEAKVVSKTRSVHSSPVKVYKGQGRSQRELMTRAY
ncbi:hypothetical protein YC2023_108412 [Brassica napus]